MSDAEERYGVMRTPDAIQIQGNPLFDFFEIQGSSLFSGPVLRDSWISLGTPLDPLSCPEGHGTHQDYMAVASGPAIPVGPPHEPCPRCGYGSRFSRNA